MVAIYIVNDNYSQDRVLAGYYYTKAVAEQAIEDYEISYNMEYSHLEIVRV